MSSAAQQIHITPLRTYMGVFAALLFLTAVTVTIAQVDFGPWNLVVAMLVAAIKAILVAFVFMHLWYDNKLYFIVFASAVAFLGIFIILTMFDTERRADIYDEVARPIRPNAAMYDDTTRTMPPHAESEAAGEAVEHDSSAAPDSATFIDSAAVENAEPGAD